MTIRNLRYAMLSTLVALVMVPFFSRAQQRPDPPPQDRAPTALAFASSPHADLPRSNPLAQVSIPAAPAPKESLGKKGAISAAPGTSGEEDQTPSPAPEDKVTLSVEDEPLAAVMRALSSRLQQPITVSRKAGRYKVSGHFDLSRPMDLIESLASALGLIWYFDGRVVYLYDNAEAKTEMLSLPDGMLAELIEFLKSAALYDNKYPFSTTRDKTGIYFYGPPKYVEIVDGAIRILKEKKAQQERQAGNSTGARRIEVVKLKHALVSDRSFSVRGERINIPGIAAVLQQALAGRALVSDVRATDEKSKTGRPNGDAADGTRTASDWVQKSARANSDFFKDEAAADMDDPYNASFDALPQHVDQFAQPTHLAVRQADAGEAPARVIPYSNNNSLLLEGYPQQIAGIKELIAVLDQPKRQIEMSLWVIDISKGDVNELGAKFGISLGGTGKFDVSVNLGASAAAMSREQATKFIAEVTALSAENRAQVVSRPILLTQDNVPALFDNSHTYFVKLEGYKVASLEKVTYGTMINVLPHVASEHGRIEMKLDIEDGKRDAPSNSDGGDDLGTVTNTQISTVARVMHDQSLLIGGYTLEDQGDTISKIPFLGDIPYLGALFRYKKNNAKQYVRMFLIQPRVLPEDAAFEGADSIPSNQIVDNAVDALRRRLEQHSVSHTQH